MSERTPDVPEVGDEVLVLGTAGPYTVVARNPSGPTRPADARPQRLPHLCQAADVPTRWVLPAGDVDDQALLNAATASPGQLWVIPEPTVVDTEIASLEHAVIESALALHNVRGAPADTVLNASRTLYRNTTALADAIAREDQM